MPYTPYKKKFSKPKKTYRRRPVTRNRYKRSLMSTNSNITRGVYFFKRSLNLRTSNNFVVDGSRLTKGINYVSFDNGSAAAGVNIYASFASTFTLGDLPNVTEFTSLFDQYILRKVVIKFTPYSNSSEAYQAGASYGNWAPILHTAIDHDSANLPDSNETGIQDLMQYSSYKRRPLIANKSFTVIIKPRWQGAAYGASAILTATSGSRTQWIDMARTEINHFGLRGVIEGISPVNNLYITPIRIEATYYFRCKGVR